MPKTVIRKRGSSHFVVIPPLFMKESGLMVGSTVEVSVIKADEIPSLEDLIKATPKNLHVSRRRARRVRK